MSIDLATRPHAHQAASTPAAPPRPVRVGVLGAGEQSTVHLLPALLRLPLARITVLADPMTARRDRLADRLGVPVRLSNVTEVVASGQVDCLVAACPPLAHEQIATAAIEAGVPVFVEKPPAVSTAALTELAAAAESAGVLTGVGMNFRWAAPIHRLRQELTSPAYGTPSMLSVRHVASKPTDPMWDLPLWRTFLLAQAIHPIDLLLTLAGSPVVDIQPACRLAGNGTWLGLQLQHANDAISTLVCGNQAPRFEHRVEVTTTAGITATLTDLAELNVAGGSTDDTGLQQRGTSSRWRPSPLDVGYDRTGFGGELAAFCAAVAAGGRFAPSLSDLVPTYQIMDQLNPTGGTR